MEQKNESEFFFGIEPVKEKNWKRSLIMILVFILLAGSLLTAIFSIYYFNLTANLPNIIDVYEGEMVNNATKGYLTVFCLALLTFLSGAYFIYRKQWRIAFISLFLGNLLLFFLSNY